jgi:hypothetical protein
MHVSQTTADALIAKGKSHWLVAREDKIEVKGKGEMQTYYVTVNSEKSVRTAMSSLVYDSNGGSDVENEEMENPDGADPTP